MKVEQIQRAMSVGVIGGLGAIGSADLYAKMTRTAAKSAARERVKVLFGQQAFDDADMAGAENAQTNTRKLYVFDMLREFEQRGTSAVLLPCFISHTFIDEVQAEVGVPIIDMVAAIRRHLAQRLPKLQKIGVLTSSYVRKKALFERLCEQEDLTSSQVVRRMIRAYIEERLGRPWKPGDEDPLPDGPAAGGVAKRRTSRT